MTARFLILLMLITMPRYISGADARDFASRGIESYRSGKYAQARKYFLLSMQEAILQARKDWVLKAVLNLVDLELDNHNLEEAKNLLDKIPEVDEPYLRAVYLWKYGQYCFAAGKPDSALILMKEARKLCGEEQDFCMAADMDRLRIELEDMEQRSEAVNRIDLQVQEIRKGLPKTSLDLLAGLEGFIAMKKNNYGEASRNFKRAAEFRRNRGELAKMAKALNFMALALFMDGEKEKAREICEMSIAAFKNMDLVLSGLHAYTLLLYLTDNQSDLEKIKLNLELSGKTIPGFDVNSVLKGYNNFAQLPSFPDNISTSP